MPIQRSGTLNQFLLMIHFIAWLSVARLQIPGQYVLSLLGVIGLSLGNTWQQYNSKARINALGKQQKYWKLLRNEQVLEVELLRKGSLFGILFFTFKPVMGTSTIPVLIFKDSLSLLDYLSLRRLWY
jgi:hypothetical protein